jgi:bacterioferritin
MEKTKLAPNRQLLDVLNQTLELEYTLIIHYPRIAEAIRDHETKQLTLSLGIASISHFDTVSKAITKLGGVPRWSFEPYPYGQDLKKIFQVQLEKENLALQLHQQIAAMTSDDFFLRDKFSKLSSEEGSHIQTVEKILSRLG